MTNNLLYFPYINVPNNSWTIRSILYWDNVGAIVPQIYKEKPNKFERDMLNFVQQELIQQVFPDNYIYQLQHFTDSFIRLITQPKFNLAKSQKDFKEGHTSRIHFQKADYRLFSELEQMDVAKRKNWEWFNIESRIARLYMMYLVTVISKSGQFTLGTDDPINIDFSLQQKGLSHYSQITRGKFLKDLMPYPLNPDLNKLRNFKQKYGKQLKTFRNKLETTIIEVTTIKDGEQRNFLYKLKLEELNHQREEIFEKLNESKVGQVVLGTLFGLTSAGIGFVTENNPLGIYGLGNAVYSAFQGYGKKDLLNSDIAYLALIDKKFGLK
ncbi:MAG: hypothetical protein JXA06_06160 [Bacteroidetes bacterium]|nr:hypothetical protein [Bacteroidota bacterium]